MSSTRSTITSYRLALAALVPVGLALSATFVSAEVPHTHTAGDVLTATDLNENFAALVDLTSAQQIGGDKAFTDTVTVDGALGVGTAPGNALSVFGNANFGQTTRAYAGPDQYGALELPRGSILWSNSNPQSQLYFASNATQNGDANGTFEHIASGPAVGIGLDNGTMFIFTSPNQAAGTDIELASSSRLAILGNGNVGLGTNTPVSRLDLGGGCMTGSSCSDARLKENIKPVQTDGSYLSRVLSLEPVTFTWRGHKDDEQQLGLIAQQVEAVFPDIVSSGGGKDSPKGLSCTGLDAAMILALKEQQATVDAQKRSIDALTRRLDKLEARAR